MSNERAALLARMRELALTHSIKDTAAILGTTSARIQVTASRNKIRFHKGLEDYFGRLAQRKEENRLKKVAEREAKKLLPKPVRKRSIEEIEAAAARSEMFRQLQALRSVAKRREERRIRRELLGRPEPGTDEWRRKQSELQSKRMADPEMRRRLADIASARGSEFYKKGVETRRLNGTLGPTEETKAKMRGPRGKYKERGLRKGKSKERRPDQHCEHVRAWLVEKNRVCSREQARCKAAAREAKRTAEWDLLNKKV